MFSLLFLLLMLSLLLTRSRRCIFASSCLGVIAEVLSLRHVTVRMKMFHKISEKLKKLVKYLLHVSLTRSCSLGSLHNFLDTTILFLSVPSSFLLR